MTERPSPADHFPAPVVAVVIPCHRVGDAVFRVIDGIGPEVHRIYVVDDCCPENTGDRVEQTCSDTRVTVLRHSHNKGVGGAVISGYQQAANDGATVVVKLDGDGQMDPALIGRFIRPILEGRADYTKGNRFYRLSSLKGMPPIRLIGNAVLSFLTKFSSGYWQVFDPTNGYTAIHGSLLRHMPLDKISQDYFFESDMLFRLNTLRAVVRDIPMDAIYADEVSGLKIGKVIPRFLSRHAINLGKRLFYNYFLRDFQIASLALLAGLPLTLFGVIFGASAWSESAHHGIPATAGTVMLAALPILIGVQLLLLAMAYDIQNQPSIPAHLDIE